MCTLTPPLAQDGHEPLISHEVMLLTVPEPLLIEDALVCQNGSTHPVDGSHEHDVSLLFQLLVCPVPLPVLNGKLSAQNFSAGLGGPTRRQQRH